MNGILVVNHFLVGEKYKTLYNHLMKTACDMNIALEIKTNLELSCRFEKADFALFWDKDTNLARRLEKYGVPVFNCAEAIEKCDDKARTYIELYKTVKQPETYIAPKCYFKSDMSAFITAAADALGFPLVFKECFGSFGQQVHLCRNFDEIAALVSDRPFILQKFIAKSAGRDKRLEIVDGECVCSVMRENDGDFRSNVTNGGKMTPCTASDSEIKTAVMACRKLGLTFGGVDILDDGSVCEVNSNAHIINIMNAAKTDIAPYIFETIKRKI